MALKIFEQSLLVAAPVSALWESLYQVEQWKEWNRYIRDVELLESPKSDAIGLVTPAFGSQWRFRITKVAPGQLIEWERSFSLMTKLIQSYSLTNNAEGAVLTLRAGCEGKFERVVGFLSEGRLSRDLERQARELKSYCERYRRKAA